MSDQHQPWEPDPRRMGNWTSMFENGRAERAPDAAMSPASGASSAGPGDGLADDGCELDMTDYKPWVLQRGRSRPAMLLHLRRFEPKSGFWLSWQLSYPHLIAAEYVGDRMLSLDFGTRQFMIEGKGLDELARYLQSGSVLLLQEFSAEVWTSPGVGPLVRSISHLK